MRTVVDVTADRAGGSGTLAMLTPEGERARRMASVLAVGRVGRGCRVGFFAVEARVSQTTAIRRKVVAEIVAEVGLTPFVVPVIPYGQLPKTSSGNLRRAETGRHHLLGRLG